ncbi:cyclic pyranopterin monophosphate synthase MoaC [Neolewinella lacunae]|uniref:Cyclic pyranopterin monophosphate synthase MoaC n=1 Tax=Neolewinella lacunae TaxID=1517758 RepID=A0A923PLC7_9BACT|nr:cyclic pyranopterin monophosphate synthase MoaC [Neolewinella lacunae]MBC6996180.1 cyclic pyranopterin monophosphate synthase MoaC [Neolewinella lacunae]MDN3635354.1 cyclic pyranopterin monophosphate synthase MoaC [Neolewinella lacunae]
MAFSHLNQDGKPAMVDVGDKAPTTRIAEAEAYVVLGEKIMAELTANDFVGKKGAILQTAILAGTMAVKQTWSVIPLCHAIPIYGCDLTIVGADAGAVKVTCRVRTEGPTGVEMEALHGAAVAALTVYDMCKSLSHAIRIEGLQLVSKSGGKSDYQKTAG